MVLTHQSAIGGEHNLVAVVRHQLSPHKLHCHLKQVPFKIFISSECMQATARANFMKNPRFKNEILQVWEMSWERKRRRQVFRNYYVDCIRDQELDAKVTGSV